MKPKPFAFIRKYDGEVYVPHPKKKNRWINKTSYDQFGLDGYEHWNTDTFENLVHEGYFEIAYTKYAMTTLSTFYRLQTELEEAKIKKLELETNKCYYCGMVLHNCLCSHDDDDD